MRNTEVPQYEPSVFKKKNTMHNQNTISIIGTSTAYPDTLPSGAPTPLSPVAGSAGQKPILQSGHDNIPI